MELCEEEICTSAYHDRVLRFSELVTVLVSLSQFCGSLGRREKSRGEGYRQNFIFRDELNWNLENTLVYGEINLNKYKKRDKLLTREDAQPRNSNNYETMGIYRGYIGMYYVFTFAVEIHFKGGEIDL